MRISRMFLSLAALALALPALAQQKPNVGRVFVVRPKPGMTQQFEEGRKRHNEFHRKQNDTWAWQTFQVETGEAMGSYVTVTFGHTWQDFDTWEAKMGPADAADAGTNMGPYIAGETNGFWVYLGDFSRPPESTQPRKMSEVFHFMVNPDAEEKFVYAIRKIHEAIGKTNWQPHQPYAWYGLANGGETPHFVLVLPHNSWAEMAEPEVSFDAMIEKAFGREEAEPLLRSLSETIRHQWTETLLYRSDLSYVPAAQ